MDLKFLTNTPLFQGSSERETQDMLACLGAHEKSYKKGETIYRAGDQTAEMGLVLSGGVNIEADDFWGNKTILGRAEPGSLFAETYACISQERMLVSAVAAECSTVLFLNAARVLSVCPNACAFHGRLLQNLLRITARKNLALSRRSLHTSSKYIRGRLLSYLSEQAALNESRRFVIPFDRQQLADYLGVDRSALSGELGKMRREGILSFRKNSFVLNKAVAELTFCDRF